MTNPPFGSDIPVSEVQILEQFEFARNWKRDEEGNGVSTTSRSSGVCKAVSLPKSYLSNVASAGYDQVDVWVLLSPMVF